MIKLSKVVPERVKTVYFQWCHPKWQIKSKQWGGERFRSCEWCRYKFKDGDYMGLAAPTKGKNMLLCHDCAQEALRAGDKGGEVDKAKSKMDHLADTVAAFDMAKHDLMEACKAVYPPGCRALATERRNVSSREVIVEAWEFHSNLPYCRLKNVKTGKVMGVRFKFDTLTPIPGGEGPQ